MTWTIRAEQIATFEKAGLRRLKEQYRLLLARHRPDSTRIRLPRMEAFLDDGIARARELGLDASADVYLFLVACFDHGPDFHRDPTIEKLLRTTSHPLPIRLDAVSAWLRQEGKDDPTHGGLPAIEARYAKFGW